MDSTRNRPAGRARGSRVVGLGSEAVMRRKRHKQPEPVKVIGPCGKQPVPPVLEIKGVTMPKGYRLRGTRWVKVLSR